MELRNKRWSQEELFKQRKEVLSQWPTGKELQNLDEAISYWKQLPDEKILSKKLSRAKAEGRILIFGFTGHATIEESLEQLQHIEQRGVEVHGLFFDTFTRNNKFVEAQRSLDNSLSQGRSTLNGYPIVNHGLSNTRKIREASNAPIVGVAGGPDSLLATEMALASGFSTVTGDIETMKFCKRYPMEMVIRNHQYVKRLVGYYTEQGAPASIAIPGNLCGWDSPGVKIVALILSSLLAAEQGVKHIAACLGLTCNLIQDVAALQVCRELAEWYLSDFGYNDVVFSIGGYPYQGSWPDDRSQMAGMIAWSAVAPMLAGVDYFINKSLDEASFTPSKESTGDSAKIAKQMINVLGRQRMPESEDLNIEKQMIRLEVKAILDKVVELGNGDIAVGQVRAVAAGLIDAAFFPWEGIADKVLPIRDSKGAIRYFEHGNLPLPKEVIEYHRQKIAEREKEEGREANIEMVIEDLSYVSKPVMND